MHTTVTHAHRLTLFPLLCAADALTRMVNGLNVLNRLVRDTQPTAIRAYYSSIKTRLHQAVDHNDFAVRACKQLVGVHARAYTLNVRACTCA